MGYFTPKTRQKRRDHVRTSTGTDLRKSKYTAPNVFHVLIYDTVPAKRGKWYFRASKNTNFPASISVDKFSFWCVLHEKCLAHNAPDRERII